MTPSKDMTTLERRKHESDKYNGMEEYCGTDYYFTVDGETWYGETIAEILDEVVGSH
jgi:hypothetical protein